MGIVRDVTVAQLEDFDEIIDVRAPEEFADDHLPGAVSAPVLYNEERARIGTLYKQASPFIAKRAGAALIARNIAQHLETQFADRPKQWRPLIYCWRGGQRSGAMAHILAQVGWSVGKLDGGYKRYRQHILNELNRIPESLSFQVICGPTGSGKSRLLQALVQEGAQVLDLEVLAHHRGSLLGQLPDQPQPPQRLFESRLWEVLRQFDPNQPVFVESESRRIGQLTVPNTLLLKMRAGHSLEITAAQDLRTQWLCADYAHLIARPSELMTILNRLTVLHGKELISDWHNLIHRGQWHALVHSLLEKHYDPAYQKSTQNNYAAPSTKHCYALRSAADLQPAARQIILDQT